MIRHGQFLKDIELLALMHRSCLDDHKHRQARHPQWTAVLMEGTVDEIARLRSEMHEYLRLPEVLGEVSLPPPADETPAIETEEKFLHALEQLQRLYRSLGEVRTNLLQYCPRLYSVVARSIAPQLTAVERSMGDYLRFSELEQVVRSMEGANGEAGGSPASTSTEEQGSPL
jgi:hypothetical protein